MATKTPHPHSMMPLVRVIKQKIAIRKATTNIRIISKTNIFVIFFLPSRKKNVGGVNLPSHNHKSIRPILTYLFFFCFICISTYIINKLSKAISPYVAMLLESPVCGAVERLVSWLVIWLGSWLIS